MLLPVVAVVATQPCASSIAQLKKCNGARGKSNHFVDMQARKPRHWVCSLAWMLTLLFEVYMGDQGPNQNSIMS
eukprot:4305067-Amphidinium_carterae.1